MNAPHAAGGDAAAIDHFVHKWFAREPEMALAEVYCPPALRPRFRAWGALLHELREAAFELSDARVVASKLPWWAEELVRIGNGEGRHPLAAALAVPGLPWQPLAAALLDTVADDRRPPDPAAAIAQLQPLARAIAAVEAGLFDAGEAVRGSDVAIAVHLLKERLPHGLGADDQARLPMNLLARHGLDAAAVAAGRGEALLRDWAGELLAAAPERLPQAPLLRRLRLGFDRSRLQRLRAGRGFAPPAPLASVLRGWWIARQQ